MEALIPVRVCGREFAEHDLTNYTGGGQGRGATRAG